MLPVNQDTYENDQKENDIRNEMDYFNFWSLLKSSSHCLPHNFIPNYCTTYTEIERNLNASIIVMVRILRAPSQLKL